MSAEPNTEPPKTKRSWLRVVVMVEDTEANRDAAGDFFTTTQRSSRARFEGEVIIKAESLFILYYFLPSSLLEPDSLRKPTGPIKKTWPCLESRVKKKTGEGPTAEATTSS